MRSIPYPLLVIFTVFIIYAMLKDLIPVGYHEYGWYIIIGMWSIDFLIKALRNPA